MVGGGESKMKINLCIDADGDICGKNCVFLDEDECLLFITRLEKRGTRLLRDFKCFFPAMKIK